MTWVQTKEDQLLECCKAITTAIPSAEVCVHYSLKWNYKHGVDQSFEAFSDFCACLSKHERSSILLISGGGKKRKLDTVEVSHLMFMLEYLKEGLPFHGAKSRVQGASESMASLAYRLLTILFDTLQCFCFAGSAKGRGTWLHQ